MLDVRIQTFLTVCETMSLTRAAERLHLTQPAVTQHIHFLEEVYQCKLFRYSGRTLYKTQKGEQFERFAKSMRHNAQNIESILRQPPQEGYCLPLGATKTIGEYVIAEKIKRYLAHPEKNLSLTVSNTELLLKLLEEGKIDLALIEGYFDKTRYDYQLLREEPFVGICARAHPFAGREVGLEELFFERLIAREPGSGTRTILEQLLGERSYSFEQFLRVTEISNFSMICELVRSGFGISFLYQAVLQKNNEGIATFSIHGTPVKREFNYVFLKNLVFREEINAFIAQ